VASAPAATPASLVIEPRLTRAETWGLGLLVLAALAVRCIHWWQNVLIFNDGPTFLALAQQMAAGRWSEALAHPFHPLYPFLTLFAQFATSDWERAAAAVSIVSGAAAVAFLFLFLRSAFDRRSAWVGAAILVVHPRVVDFSSNVQSDGLYLALFLGAVALAWFALQTQRISLAGWAGVFIGLSYLTRPEGLGLLLVASALVLRRTFSGEWRWTRALGFTAVLWAGLLGVAVPYMTAMRVENGEWRITGKKPVLSLLRFEDRARAREEAEARLQETRAAEVARSETASSDAAPPEAITPQTSPAWSRLAVSVGRLVSAASSGVRPWFLGLLLLGVFARRGLPGPAGEMVLGIVALYAVVDFAQLLHSGYLDMRHVLPPLVPAFGYFSAGIDAVARGFARVTLRAAPAPAWVGAGLLAIALAAGLGQALRPEKNEARAERAAAEWLRTNAAEQGAVAAPKSRIAYYAQRPAVVLHQAPPQGQLAWLRAQGARYVVVDDDDLEKFPELSGARGAGLALLHCVRVKSRWAVVYEVRGEGASQAASAVTDLECAVAVGAAATHASGTN
jgi:4-amino-4-deoxy-L-arabinose transferase-like glycosyltransferase